MVHATCYGDPLIRGIPGGDCFCLRDGRWGHILCALLVLVFFKNPKEERASIVPRFLAEDGKRSVTSATEQTDEVPLFLSGSEGQMVMLSLLSSVVKLPSLKTMRFLAEDGKRSATSGNSANGFAIECFEPKCSLAFYVSCALEALKDECDAPTVIGSQASVLEGD
uniref:Uncharacterized protein n=1 Tax=Nelumbo nucifera TaxID=4432 RepID=A0A822Z9T9_NELNU|nr:TPA_asm: hypothetical protein HUJ06_001284 [Nelumbo nucifera]